VKKVKDAFPLLKLAVTYKVPDIEAQCTELLKKEITDETALAIYNQSGNYGDGSLHEQALDYICKLVAFFYAPILLPLLTMIN